MVLNHPSFPCKQQSTLWVLLFIKVGSIKILIECIESIGELMASNQLMLNPSKSELMRCVHPCRVHLIDRSALMLCEHFVNRPHPLTHFDESLSMSQHINQLVQNYFVYMCFSVHSETHFATILLCQNLCKLCDNM